MQNEINIDGTIRDCFLSHYHDEKIDLPKKLYFVSELRENLEVIGPKEAAWIFARRKIFSDYAFFRITEHWSMECFTSKTHPQFLPPGTASLTLMAYCDTSGTKHYSPDLSIDEYNQSFPELPQLTDLGIRKQPCFGEDIRKLPGDIGDAVYSTTFLESCIKMKNHIETKSESYQKNIACGIEAHPVWSLDEKSESTKELDDVVLCLRTLIDILHSSQYQKSYGQHSPYDIDPECFEPSGSPITGWLKHNAMIGEATLIDDEVKYMGVPLDGKLEDSFKKGEALMEKNTMNELDETLSVVCKNNHYRVSELWELMEWGEDILKVFGGRPWYQLILGFDIDPTDPFDQMAIEEADRKPELIEPQRSSLIGNLLERGADPTVVDDEGMSALDYARKNAQLKPEIIKTLEDNIENKR